MLQRIKNQRVRRIKNLKGNEVENLKGNLNVGGQRIDNLVSLVARTSSRLLQATLTPDILIILVYTIRVFGCHLLLLLNVRHLLEFTNINRVAIVETVNHFEVKSSFFIYSFMC